MAVLLRPTPVASADPRLRSSGALIVSLVALITGCIMLLASVVPLGAPSPTIDVLDTAVNRAIAVRFSKAPNTQGATKDLHFLLSGPVTTEDTAGHSCLTMREESAHLATIPLCHDLHQAFAMLAPGRYGARPSGLDGTGALAAQAAARVAQAPGDLLAESASPAAAETVLLVEPTGPPQGKQVRIYSRLAFPPDAEWVVDLKGGPLTLFVQYGRVGVQLERGSAQLERHDPLFANQLAAIPEDHRVLLQSGDRLVVTSGTQVRVDNDDSALAILSASRQQTSPPGASGSK